MAATPISCVAGYYTLCEIERRNAAQVAGQMGDRMTKGLKTLIKKHDLPFVTFNQGSICHLETVGTMHYSINWMKPWDYSGGYEADLYTQDGNGIHGCSLHGGRTSHACR